jgi:peptide/nickel transport system permease protein
MLSQFSPLTLLSAAVVAVIVLVAIAAPFLPLSDPVAQNLSLYLQPPSPQHLLGTDEFGRDVLSRVVWGARLSLLAGTVPVLLAFVTGIILGLVSAYYGGILDEMLMRAVDFLFSLPYFLIALIVVSLLGPGLFHAMLAVAIGLLPSFTRLSRASALSIKGLPYVRAAEALGLSKPRIMFLHILPNYITSMLVFSTVKIGESILSMASLSFLGLGAQPPAAEWGLMLNDSKDLILTAPYVLWGPSIALSLTVLSFNMLADGVRDRLDPRYRF